MAAEYVILNYNKLTPLLKLLIESPPTYRIEIN